MSAKALWLLAAGVLLVEAALRVMPDGYMVRTLHGRMEEIVTLPAPRVQIMGDSVTAGINAAEVAAAAGMPAGSIVNYSLPGTSPLFAYYTLRRELAAGRVPKWILFAPHPANLETPMVDRFIGRFCTAEESGDLLAHGETLPDWLFGAACRVSVGMRYREEFRVAVTEGNFGFFETLRTPVATVLQTRMEPPPTEPGATAVNAAGFPAQLSAPFFVDRANSVGIDRFCELAEAHGIQVMWMTMPVIGLFKERAMGGGGEAKYEAYLDGLAARHRNVVLFHRELEVYPDSWFADAWHLNRYGAWRFSIEAGGALRQNSGGTPRGM